MLNAFEIVSLSVGCSLLFPCFHVGRKNCLQKSSFKIWKLICMICPIYACFSALVLFHFWKITANHLDAFIIPGIFYFEKWAQKCLVYFAKLHFILKKNTHAWDDDISTLNLNEIWDSAFSHIACAAASVRSGHPFQNKTPTSCFQFNLKDGIIFIPMNAFNVLTEAYSP